MAQPDLQRDVPAAVLRKLKEMETAKAKSRMDYWKLLEPVVKWEDEVAHVKLLAVEPGCACGRGWANPCPTCTLAGPY